jgi:hypothetical protein
LVPIDANAVAWCNDDVGLRLHHGGPRRVGIEHVDDDRLRSGGAHLIGLRSRPGGADHLVPGLDQRRDQPLADRAGRTGDEHSHCSS